MRDGAFIKELKRLPEGKRRIALLVVAVSVLAILTAVLNRNPDRQYLAESSGNQTHSASSSQQNSSGSGNFSSEFNQQDELDNHHAGVPSEEFDHNQYPHVAPEPGRAAKTPSEERHPGSKPLTPRTADGESNSAPSWLARAADWKKKLDSMLTREGEFSDDVESLWRGRKRMHQRLLQGSLRWSDKAEEIVLSRLEQNQFPKDCSRRPWLAHLEYDSDIISDVHMFQPALLLGLIKGWTVVPIAGQKNVAFEGCGGTSQMHLGCFFNISGCRFEDHPTHLESLQKLNHTHLEWDAVLQMDEPVANYARVAVVKAVRSPSTSHLYENGVRSLKQQLWDELVDLGVVGIYGKDSNFKGQEGQLRDVSNAQIDFMFFCILSSWMLKRTGSSVQQMANEIMLKYSMMDGQPAWSSPVLVVYMPHLLKGRDPHVKRTSPYWKPRDYIKEIREIEAEYGFKWPSIFVMSDSPTALQRFAGRMNGRSRTPDSENTKFGKRFIMYDWTMNISDIESTYGGYSKIPPRLKHREQLHRLASLYIISKLGDYAILSYESQVGRFVFEAMAAQQRLSKLSSTRGPVAFSLDAGWHHD